tara:strand:- start:56 stop:292 length:237 start_codon:yes stop_codon:yes gene_type:complete
MKKVIINNGVVSEVDMTAEEISAKETEDAINATKDTEKLNAFNQSQTDALNGNQKLIDLGLTQAEATALTGYKPPVEE